MSDPKKQTAAIIYQRLFDLQVIDGIIKRTSIVTFLDSVQKPEGMDEEESDSSDVELESLDFEFHTARLKRESDGAYQFLWYFLFFKFLTKNFSQEIRAAVYQRDDGDHSTHQVYYFPFFFIF